MTLTDTPVGQATPILDRLTGDGEPFLAHHFGAAPLHVPRATRTGRHDDAAALLTLDDVDQLVSEGGLRAPGFRMVQDGVTLPRGQVTRHARIGSRPVDDLADVAAIHAAFDHGASLVLQGLHRSWPPLVAWCRALEAELTHPVQANAYLTPPGSRGLDLHEDPHDVFVVQTHGAKRWVVHPPDGSEPWDLVLTTGDVLYLPAGTRHAAESRERASLHVTLGIRTIAWRAVVSRIVEGHLADEAAGGPLPAGWAHDPDGLRTSLAGELRALADALEATDPAAALDAEAERFWRSRRPDRRGGLRDLLALDDLDDHTLLRTRPGLGARLRTDGDHVVLVLPDREVRGPAHLHAPLEHVLAAETSRPADLADHLDHHGRLVLCRRLLRDGLLTLAAPHGGDGP